jgi:hypothetical protein
MRVLKLAADIVTRPIGGLLLTLPIILLCLFLVLVLWPSPKGGLLLGDFISFPWYPRLEHFPSAVLTLMFVASWAAFGGSISSISFIADYDLPSSFRVVAICLIQTVLGLASGMVMYVVLTGFLSLILRDLDSTAFSPYVLAFLAFIAGITSDRVLAAIRSLGVQAFKIEVIEESRSSRPSASPSESGASTSKGDSSQLVQKLSAIEDRITSLQIRPVLDNFDGVVSVRLCDVEGLNLQAVEGKDGRFSVRSDRSRHCQAILRIGAGQKLDDAGFEKPLQIKNGNDSDSVTFHVVIDSNEIDFKPDTDRVTFSPKGQSRLMRFSFRAPDKDGMFDLFAEVSQRGRTITVVALTLVVGDG